MDASLLFSSFFLLPPCKMLIWTAQILVEDGGLTSLSKYI